MKAFIFASLLLTSFHSFAGKVTNFECRLDSNPKDVITFRIENLGQKDMTVLSLDADDDYSGIFATKSKNAKISQLVDTINGQGGDMRIGSDRISFFGDSAGIDFAYFDLYKDSGYTRGFVRMEFDFGNDKSYSKVSCTKK